ncbi:MULTISPECIES: Nramp family divalent metal transporter [Acetobacter]|jgi:manganese transport protein|uniref:Divalent metal cation transporter MntH n=1 Tax=Acetobacter lovaniensis TaxID=104100 RepID=A0A841QBA6_9PROT|nr:Nramp family divalent metal transporter [Acetobacter lovaniensis]MBB6455482.1 manganese transport protein [Acetobacter lovaniensis]MCI1697581.1 Nramp family divalent metal transporter [Acetobacter lovaniensis]MCI1795336.1 Nramp family divalent metal transporter [Acetobacter lovaniensis]MCP1238680.1 Nramp family divalent metal transporter [Acetobacter lovaniensis]NHN79886.1 Mn(2+) uptake NRAMP transporter MntH [Acetobacter lovaniensis]
MQPPVFHPDHADSRHSLPEAFASIRVPRDDTHWMRRFLSYVGPGYMVSIGYMDPGNWATDLQGGARFGYVLLSVILLSNCMAILLQALSARLGIATGLDLAQACRQRFHPVLNVLLWVACELAIIACDLAEVIGTAVALQLLFHIPLLGGAFISSLDALLVLFLMNRGFRYLEAFIIGLLSIIALCFAVQLIAAAPPLAAVLAGMKPSLSILTNSEMLYIAIGIIGATVMPHNLYLHSSIVQSRAYERTERGRKDAIRWATWDSSIALMLALFINAAILIVAAAAFHTTGHQDVAEIQDAYHLLSPLLGLGIASTLFALALLAAGTNSTITGTLAGQIVMEGFLHLRLPHWARRLLTRGLAIVPVMVGIVLYGNASVGQLLMASQVVLSMQLPFAVIPLVLFVSDRKMMGSFAISRPFAVLSWFVAGVILILNFKLLYDTLAL